MKWILILGGVGACGLAAWWVLRGSSAPTIKGDTNAGTFANAPAGKREPGWLGQARAL